MHGILFWIRARGIRHANDSKRRGTRRSRSLARMLAAAVSPAGWGFHVRDGMTSRWLDEPRFTTAQCDALFAAILDDDVIDPDARLPGTMDFSYSQEQLTSCYRLCRQLWKEGVDRVALARMVDGIGWRGSLDADAQRKFKHTRARFKQLRFAYAMFDARHRYPKTLDRITVTMGGLQDAFKNRQHAATVGLAVLLRILLIPMPYRAMDREIDAFVPATTESFRAYLGVEMDRLAIGLDAGDVTGREFHALRKIISRLCALCCSLAVIAPSPSCSMLANYVNSINGRMGCLHDRLVERKFGNRRNYRGDRFAIPEDIRQPLTTLVRWYCPH